MTDIRIKTIQEAVEELGIPIPEDVVKAIFE